MDRVNTSSQAFSGKCFWNWTMRFGSPNCVNRLKLLLGTHGSNLSSGRQQHRVKPVSLPMTHILAANIGWTGGLTLTDWYHSVIHWLIVSSHTTSKYWRIHSTGIVVRTVLTMISLFQLRLLDTYASKILAEIQAKMSRRRRFLLFLKNKCLIILSWTGIFLFSSKSTLSCNPVSWYSQSIQLFFWSVVCSYWFVMTLQKKL